MVVLVSVIAVVSLVMSFSAAWLRMLPGDLNDLFGEEDGLV